LSVSARTLPGEIERDDIKSELRRYHDLILDYRRGAPDVADRVLVWDAKRLRRVLGSINGSNDESRPWATVRFMAGAMMHTDTALRLLDRGEVDAASLHLDTASQLLQKAGPEAVPYAARWYQTTSRVLRDRGLLERAEKLLETARARLPRDSTVLYESATLQELLATNTVLPNIIYLPDLKAPPPKPETSTGDSSVRVSREDIDDLKRRRAGQLNRAAAWLRESLESDSTNLLARLHLGRVQSLRNQNDDALTLLRQASASDDPAVAYLAFLFSGAVHERAGLLAASVQDYRAAIERFPLNQAAHIALSAVLQRSGRGDESRDVLGGVVGASSASRREPWSSYLVEPSSVNVGRLDLLRREARQ
jgi:tetratricopeptide (TPR) repeat protein